MQNSNISVAVMILACVLVIVPSFSFAHITSTTEASSSSGGNTSGGNSSVVEGSSSASARVTNIINARGESEVSVEVETETDGDVHTKSLRQRIQSREPFEIRVATSSRGAEARSDIRITVGEDNSTTGTSTQRISDMFRSWVDRLLSSRTTATNTNTPAKTEVEEDSTVLSPIENNSSQGMPTSDVERGAEELETDWFTTFLRRFVNTFRVLW